MCIRNISSLSVRCNTLTFGYLQKSSSEHFQRSTYSLGASTQSDPIKIAFYFSENMLGLLYWLLTGKKYSNCSSQNVRVLSAVYFKTNCHSKHHSINTICQLHLVKWITACHRRIMHCIRLWVLWVLLSWLHFSLLSSLLKMISPHDETK